MEENDNRNGKDLSIDEKKAEAIAEKIRVAILNDKEEISIEDGRTIIPVKMLKDDTKEEEYSVEFGGRKIATVKKGEKVPSDSIKKEIQRYQEVFDFEKSKIGLERTLDEKDKGNPESLKMESELNKAMSEGRAHKLRMGREITAAGEDMSLMMKRMFGERAEEVYRVRDEKDSHKFKYIAKNSKGEYFEPRGSRGNEGTNPRQMCWIQNSDGTFERKGVDDMKVFGKYVIATDINVGTDDTRTLIGQRTPRGEYILMPALDHRVADTANNSYIKDNLSRGNSIWEIEDVILAAKLGDTIRGTKLDGKLSAEEVEFIRRLKKEGLTDEKVRKVVDAVLIVGELKDRELNNTSIKAILDSVDSTARQLEELKKEEFSDDEIKRVMKLMHEDKTKFQDAKEEVLKGKEEKKEEKDEGMERGARGEVPEGPWSNSRH